MLGNPLNARIFLCTQDTDMRKSFDSLRGIIRSAMHLDPLSGSLFIFKNKRGDRIKCIYWDDDGFAMWYKVLQRGTFQFPDLQNISSAGLEIDASTMRLILDGVDLGSIRQRPRFRPTRRQPENPRNPFVWRQEFCRSTTD
jgi:transposase